jgi:hypothetical protein
LNSRSDPILRRLGEFLGSEFPLGRESRDGISGRVAEEAHREKLITSWESCYSLGIVIITWHAVEIM